MPRAQTGTSFAEPPQSLGDPSSGGRARKPAGRPHGSAVRAIFLVCAAGVIIVAGLTGVTTQGASVAATVKNFLLDWQAGNYPGAAALTTGNNSAVATELRAAYIQLGAADLALGMGPLPQNANSVQAISVHGDHAEAYFNATIDLGRGGLSWQYQGHLTMRRSGSGWLIVWSPSVIAPGLGAGDRLAVLTTTPRRAPILGANGRSLIERSAVIELGVIPSEVKDPARTAAQLARAVGLVPSDAEQMQVQIEAAPPQQFLELVRLSQATYAKLSKAIGAVRHVVHRRVFRRLFNSTVPLITGQVGTETAKPIVQQGEPYMPGTTVGLSGLEETYQSQLAGAPTTEVVVQNAAGKLVKVLQRWQGQPGTSVRTTIDAQIQQAARHAVGGLGYSAAIVAVRANGGQILAVASNKANGMPAVSPLSGRYQPGQSFTIISTAAGLAYASPPLDVHKALPCGSTNSRGNQTFSNVPPEHLGQSSFSADFTHACETAFVGLSYRVNPGDLAKAAAHFGIGANWQIPLPSSEYYAGHVNVPANGGEEAADMIGRGTVQVSPLDMALAAGAVDSGTWYPPSLVTSPPDPRLTPRAPFTPQVIGQLKSLMLATVSSGAAKAARVRGIDVFGQVGTAPLAGHHNLRAVWFVGFRGNVAFVVMALSRSTAFDPAVAIAHQFAGALPAGS